MGATKSNQGVFINNDDGDAIKVTQDGSDLKIETIAKSRNSSGTIVNPATEDTLSTRASETTLASRASESTLSSLRTDFNNEDFATETTQATLATSANQTNGSQKNQVVNGANTLAINVSGQAAIQNPPNLDVAASTLARESTLGTRATEATLSSFRTDFNNEDFASEATLATRATSANQTNKNQYTRLTDGTNDAVVNVSGDLQVIHVDPLPIGDNWVGRVKVGDGTDFAGILDDGGLKRLRVDAKLGQGDANVGRVKITDGTDVADVFTWGEDASTPRSLGVNGRDDNDLARFLRTDADGQLKVVTKPQSAPATATPIIYAGDTPLDLNNQTSPHDTDGAIIGSGVNFYLQAVFAGAAGDPSEDGSVAEIYWVENTNEHLVLRTYLLGQTLQFQFPDLNIARDGVQMIGDGTTTFIRIRRERLSNALQAVDVEVLGYLL